VKLGDERLLTESEKNLVVVVKPKKFMLSTNRLMRMLKKPTEPILTKRLI